VRGYKLYEVSDGVMGNDIIRGNFKSMPEALEAWYRAFGVSYPDEHLAQLIVYEALPDGTYGPSYGTKQWTYGDTPCVYPMKGTQE
jgi:hypothetical protein